VESVETMARIAGYTEEHEAVRDRQGALLRREAGAGRVAGASPVAQGLARVAATLAAELDCRLIVAFTESGSTARLVSAFRPRATIVAITHRPEVYRQLALFWGVVPLPFPIVDTTDEMILGGQALLKERGLVRPGERVLMLSGQTHSAGATNMLRVHTIS